MIRAAAENVISSVILALIPLMAIPYILNGYDKDEFAIFATMLLFVPFVMVMEAGVTRYYLLNSNKGIDKRLDTFYFLFYCGCAILVAFVGWFFSIYSSQESSILFALAAVSQVSLRFLIIYFDSNELYIYSNGFNIIFSLLLYLPLTFDVAYKMNVGLENVLVYTRSVQIFIISMLLVRMLDIARGSIDYIKYYEDLKYIGLNRAVMVLFDNFDRLVILPLMNQDFITKYFLAVTVVSKLKQLIEQVVRVVLPRIKDHFDVIRSKIAVRTYNSVFVAVILGFPVVTDFWLNKSLGDGYLSESLPMLVMVYLVGISQPRHAIAELEGHSRPLFRQSVYVFIIYAVFCVVLYKIGLYSLYSLSIAVAIRAAVGSAFLYRLIGERFPWFAFSSFFLATIYYGF